MTQILSTARHTPSIVIVQGAYQQFCNPQTVETVYDSQDFSLILGSAEAIALAAQEAWLRFQGLATAWRSERGAMSSVTESAMCPSYQAIIGMGETAIPLILAAIKMEGDEVDQWFWALKAITGEDPVSDADRGNYPLMAQAWLAWSRLHGYAW